MTRTGPTKADDTRQPATPPVPPVTPSPTGTVQPRRATGFAFNRPVIICLCYLLVFFVGFTPLVGIALAYIFRGEPHEPWEAVQYRYLIRTFWIGASGFAFVALAVLALAYEEGVAAAVAGLLALIVVVLFTARTIYAFVKAVGNEPLPRAATLLI